MSVAVSEMQKVTQQNAASAEESSSAASELNAQAEELAVLVAGFELERAAAPRPLPSPTAPPTRRNCSASARAADPLPMGDDTDPFPDF